MRIALAGNPNSGKTTMYNLLTGSNEHVGNWAGVTVDKRESTLKKNYCATAIEEVVAVDLPGAYSMSPFTSEESITSGYVKHENPDAIINIVDATNLSRSLFFTTQLLELGIPVVVALNKSDITDKKETKIDVAKLSEALGCPVVATVSTNERGIAEVAAKAIEAKGKKQVAPYHQGEINLHDKNEVEKVNKLYIKRGKELIEVDELCAGDIGCMTKLSHSSTNDTLCTLDYRMKYQPIHFSKPNYGKAIQPIGKANEEKIASGITRLLEEDQTLKFENNHETKQQFIYGIGDIHLESVVAKLKSKFKIDVKLSNMKVSYRETIRKSYTQHTKFKKQSEVHGQYGEVKILIEPKKD